MEADIDVSRQILQNRDDPRGDQEVYITGRRILELAGITQKEQGPQWTAFYESVRRGLLELDRRQLARINDDYHHPYIDRMFDGARPPAVTFGELARQSLQLAEEGGAANNTSRKWHDKQRATLALICELVGSRQTSAAQLFLELREACMSSEDSARKWIGQNLMVPREQWSRFGIDDRWWHKPHTQ